jgi:hypothetical protein
MFFLGIKQVIFACEAEVSWLVVLFGSLRMGAEAPLGASELSSFGCDSPMLPMPQRFKKLIGRVA